MLIPFTGMKITGVYFFFFFCLELTLPEACFKYV